MVRFPIRLTAFEEYFLKTDVPDYPSTFATRIEFSKQFDRGIADKAFAAIVRRNLLARCKVDDANGVVCRGSKPWGNQLDNTSIRDLHS